MRHLTFKLADQAWEMEAIGRLIYETFVEEIPQHPPNPQRTLTDKFHPENVYLIALDGERLAGMLAVRERRPFSLDQKLPDLDTWIPAGRKACELRLLAVRPEYRNGRTTRALLAHVAQLCIARGFDLALISGTTRQQKLYSHLGFVPFGPLVGAPGAWFQPMRLTLERFQSRPQLALALAPRSAPSVNLQTGPTAIAPAIARAFAQPPLAHRGAAFQRLFAETRQALLDLSGARHAQILCGSGTLANDVVAGQISLLPGRGLVLCNGEFGERLLDHARRFDLHHEALRFTWGRPLDYEAVERALRAEGYTWLWFAHCETSTGLLADLPRLAAAARAAGARVALDAVSSLGSVPLDLADVDWATGVSGKALGSYPGLCFVFHRHPARPEPQRLPRCLDLGLYAEESVPFTLSSNQLAALRAALDLLRENRRLEQLPALAAALRATLEELGMPPLAPLEHASPAVFTLTLPPGLSAPRLAARLAEEAILVSAGSRYLRERNWLQVALFGFAGEPEIAAFQQALVRLTRPGHAAAV